MKPDHYIGSYSRRWLHHRTTRTVAWRHTESRIEEGNHCIRLNIPGHHGELGLTANTVLIVGNGCLDFHLDFLTNGAISGRISNLFKYTVELVRVGVRITMEDAADSRVIPYNMQGLGQLIVTTNSLRP